MRVHPVPRERAVELRRRLALTVCLALASVASPPLSALRGADFSPSGEGGFFLRGDADQSGILEITDAIFTLNYLFTDTGGELPYCMDALDSDDDGQVLLTDAVAVLHNLFSGTFVIPQPSGVPGMDPSEDGLDCDNGRFARLRREVFTPSCAGSSCHSGTDPAGALDLEGNAAFSQLVLHPASSPAAQAAGLVRVKPGSPEESFLLRKVTGQVAPGEEHVPDLKTLIGQDGIDLVERWIRDGAPASAAEDIALPPPLLGEQIVIPRFPVPEGSGNEVLRNYYFKLKTSQVLWVNRVELVSTPGIDHWHFFSGNPLFPRPDGAFDADGFQLPVNLRDWSLRASIQSERLDWRLPAGVGIPFAPLQQTLTQVHFVNTGREAAPLGGRAVANLHAFDFDPANPPAPLGSLMVQDRRIRITPESSSQWDYGVTFSHLGHDEPVKLAAAQGHFHWRGKSFEIRLWDGLNKLPVVEDRDSAPAPGEFDRMGPENTIYLSDNGEEPPFLSFGDDGPEVPRGWGIIYRCVFSNPTDEFYCFGPAAGHEEHSIAFVYFYPGPVLRSGFLSYPPRCDGQVCAVNCNVGPP